MSKIAGFFAATLTEGHGGGGVRGGFRGTGTACGGSRRSCCETFRRTNQRTYYKQEGHWKRECPRLLNSQEEEREEDVGIMAETGSD